MQRNYVCNLVTCKNWDSIANGDEDLSFSEWRKECQECYHAKNNLNAKKCNFSSRVTE